MTAALTLKKTWFLAPETHTKIDEEVIPWLF
jgi:hypothetical protein